MRLDGIASLVFGLSLLGCSITSPTVSSKRSAGPEPRRTLDAAPPQKQTLPPKLVTGPGHTCAVRSDEVWCWGSNNHDELGDPRVGASPRPVRAPTLDGVRHLFAGTTETCAVLADTTATCWGNRQPGLRPLPDLDGVAEISWGRFRCVRGDMGQVRCTSSSGQAPQDLRMNNAVALVGSCAVGRDGSVECAKEPKPSGGRGVRVPPVRIARAHAGYQASPRVIDAARANAKQHSTLPCVLRTDGTVGCWDIMFDTPRIEGQPAADGLLKVEGIADAVEIATGRDFICGRSEDGRVACAGSPFRTTLDVGTTAGLDSITDAVQVVAGHAHACARRADDSVVCWGSNESGQLGSGSFEPHERIVEVPDFRAVELVAGAFHTCGRTAQNDVWCWGFGAEGQLGDRFTPRRTRDFASPVPALPAARDLVLLPGRTCTRDADGSVWCWGEGASTFNSEPICEPDVRGHVHCEGRGGGSSCGGRHRGERLDRAQPRRLDGGPVHAIAAWGSDLLALADDGRVLSFSGLRPCTQRPREMRSTARVVGRVPGAEEVATGGSACVRTRAGAVLCSAQTDSGELELESVPGIADAVALAVGYRHACALVEGGRVRCWGENPSGQLGSGAVGPVDEATHVPGLGDVTELAAGWFHTCGRRADGTVWCWGENEGGALGDGTTEDRARPTRVRGLEPAIAITSHRWQTCAWQETGTVACWGVRPLGTFDAASLPQREVALPPPAR